MFLQITRRITGSVLSLPTLPVTKMVLTGVPGAIKAAADYKNKYDNRVYNSKFNEHNFGGYFGYNGSWGFSHFIASKFNQTLGLIEGERNPGGAFIRPLPGGATAIPSEPDFNSIDPQIPYQHIRHLK